MSAITFAAGLVAALYVTDVNAVVWETCRFTDFKCKQLYICLATMLGTFFLCYLFHFLYPTPPSKHYMNYYQTHTESKNTGKNLIKGSCLAGLDQPELDDEDDYTSRQKGYGYIEDPLDLFVRRDSGNLVAPKDYKTCKKYAKAVWAAYLETDDDILFDDYIIQAAKDIFMHTVEAKAHCLNSVPQIGSEFYGIRCGDSSTGKVSIFVYVGIGAGGIILVIAILFIYSKIKHKSGSSYNINSGNDSDLDNGGINGDDVTLLSFGNNPNPSNSTTSSGSGEYE